MMALGATLVGCATDEASLPANLPATGSGGFFTITTGSLVDGVVSRSYNNVVRTTGGSGAVAACRVTGTAPAGLTATPSGSTCLINIPAGVAAGAFSFNLEAEDTSTPANTDTLTYRLVIRGEFSVTGFTVVDGVAGRIYSKTFVVNTNLANSATEVGRASELGNGPITACAVTGLPAGMTQTCAPAAGGVSMDITLSGPSATLLAGVSALTISVTDSNILQAGAPVVLANTLTNATQPVPFAVSLTVRGEFDITAFTVVDGVAQRSYSKTFNVTTNLSNNPVPTEVGSPEVGNGPITACAVTNLPAGMTQTCAPDVTGVGMDITLSALSAALLAGVSPLTISVTDSGIFQAPQAGAVVPAATTLTNATQPAPFAVSLTVRGEFDITAFTVVDGIVSRSYTKTFNVTTNLSNNPVPSEVGSAEVGNGPITACVVTGLPAGMTQTCAPDGTGAGMDITLSAPVATLMVGISALTITVTDTAIFQPPQAGAVVPANSVTNATQPAPFAFSLTVRDEFDITAFTVVDGVVGRSYSKTFNVTTNLSNNPVDVGQAGEFGNGPITACAVTGLPAGMAQTCAPDGAGTGMDITLSAPVATLMVGISALTITVTDTAILQPPQVGAVVPAATFTNATQAVPFAVSLTVRGEFSITAFTVVDGIAGRSYTKTFNLTTNLSNNPVDVGQAGELGNGPITACAVTGLPAGMTQTCAPAAGGVSMDITLSAPSAALVMGVSAPTISVTDSGILQAPQVGAVVPAATFTNATQAVPFAVSLTVRGEFDITAFTVVDGVAQRSYSKTFNVTTNLSNNPVPTEVGSAELGNGPITACAVTGLPAGMTQTCAPDGTGLGIDITLSAPTATLLAGVSALTISVTDSGIFQPPQAGPVVPAATTLTNATQPTPFMLNLTVRQEFDITAFTVVDGIEGRSYTKMFVVTTNLSNNPVPSEVGSAEFGNGPITACSITLPPGFTTASCAPDGTGVGMDITLSAPSATLVVGVSALTISVTDSGIFQAPQVGAVVPAATTLTNTTQPTPFAVSLTVRGEFSITAFTVVDGVAGRSYTKTFNLTTNLLNNPADVGQAGELGNGPITACAITLPPGFTTASCAPDGAGTGMDITLSAPSAALVMGVSAPTISVTDSGILQAPQVGAVVPAATFTNATQAVPFAVSLTVRGEFSITSGLPVLPDGVTNRTYNFTFTVTTDLSNDPVPSEVGSGELGNGPITSCSVAGLPAGLFSTPVVLAGGISCTVTVNGGTITAAAGNFALTLTVNDTAIFQPPQAGAVVPVGAITQMGFNLVVQPALQITLATSPPVTFNDALVGPGIGVAPDAVTGRTYGAPGASDLVFTVTGGLTPYNFSIILGAPPADIGCSQPTATTFVCNSSNLALTVASITGTFRVQVEDNFGGGNTAVPPQQLFTDTAGHTDHTITVNAALALAVNLADPLPDGVEGRSYGEAPETPLIYSATGGLGAPTVGGSYLFAANATGLGAPGAGFPATIGCAAGAAPNADQFTCATSASTITGTAGLYTPAVTVDDNGNDTTPTGAASATTDTANRNLTIQVAMTFTVNVGTVTTNPDGVNGRPYGTPAGANDLIYTAAGGLGGFVITPPGPATLPTPVACVTAAPTVTCNSAGGPVTAAAGGFPYSLSVMDTPNVTTPAATITLNPTLTINAVLALAADVTVDPPPDGGLGRSYGVVTDPCAGAVPCTPLTYTASGGLPDGGGAYVFTLPASVLDPAMAGVPADVACATNAPATIATCDSSGGSGVIDPSALIGMYNFTVIVDDTANLTTPAAAMGSVLVMRTVNVRGLLALAVNVGTITNLPDGVTGRTYGNTAAPDLRTAAIYTAAGGLGDPTIDGSYVFTSNGDGGAAASTPGFGFPAPITCTTGTNPNANLFTCTTGVSAITAGAGPYDARVNVDDLANASTPAGSFFSTDDIVVRVLNMNGALAIDSTSPLSPSAIVMADYTTTLAASGGLTPFTWSATVIPGAMGTPCENFTLAPDGTLTAVSPSQPTTSGTCMFTASVVDTANATTPAIPLAVPMALDLFVAPGGSPVIDNLVLVNGLEGLDYSQQLTATGGSLPLAWSVAPAVATATCPALNGALPGGVTLAPATGLLSGMPATTAGTFSFDICVEDFVGGSNTRRFTVVINDALVYTSNATSDDVSPIDTATNTAGAAIPVGATPLDVALTPDGTRAYVPNQNSDNVSVIDTTSNTLAATIPLMTNPGAAVVTPDGATAYVTDITGNGVLVIDTATNTVTTTISLGASIGPSAIDVTPDGAFVYVTNNGSDDVSIIDTSTNTLDAASPITLAAMAGPNGIAITPDGRFAYVANTGTSDVSVIDISTNTVTVPSIAVGTNPFGIAITPDGRSAYVANGVSSDVSVIDTNTNTVTTTIMDASFSVPVDVAITPDGTSAYVTNAVTSTVSVIDTSTNTVTTVIDGAAGFTGINPNAIAAMPYPVLHIASGTLPDATLASAYSFSVAAAGGVGAFTFSTDAAGTTALAGCNLALAANGLVSSASVMGCASSTVIMFDVTVTDSATPAQMATRTVTLTVN